ncbi:hypothetical protein [Sphingobium sp.]|uniref:hypothetical protein n=1 Tax=Sphingobium sp. TaxID=1912891 RepID=UPI00261D0EDE|nr:hypothetical protein [Sphingobium sp.]
MDRIRLAGLLKLELRDGRVIRLCDGGFVPWGSEIYRVNDTQFGIIGPIDSFEEGVGDEVPAFSITFLPASTAAAVDLATPGMQGSRLRLWIAEINDLTGQIIGTPDQQFDGMLDQVRLVTGRAKRELPMTFVPRGERFFNSNDGNTLSSAFHKSVYPGELGEDNATGLTSAVAWGVEAQPGSNGGRAASIYPGSGWSNIINNPPFREV